MTVQALKIAFPALVYFRGELSVWPEEAFRVLGFHFPAETSMLCKASARRAYVEPPGWLVDVDGRFIEFQPIGYRRSWARPISFLVQFVQSEFSVAPPRVVSSGELLQLAIPIKDGFPEAPVASSLRSFLRKQPSGAPVTRQLLEQWPI